MIRTNSILYNRLLKNNGYSYASFARAVTKEARKYKQLSVSRWATRYWATQNSVPEGDLPYIVANLLGTTPQKLFPSIWDEKKMKLYGCKR